MRSNLELTSGDETGGGGDDTDKHSDSVSGGGLWWEEQERQAVEDHSAESEQFLQQLDAHGSRAEGFTSQ